MRRGTVVAGRLRAVAHVGALASSAATLAKDAAGTDRMELELRVKEAAAETPCPAPSCSARPCPARCITRASRPSPESLLGTGYAAPPFEVCCHPGRGDGPWAPRLRSCASKLLSFSASRDKRSRS